MLGDQGALQNKEGVEEAADKMASDGDGVKSTLQPLGKKREDDHVKKLQEEKTNTSPEPAKRVRAEQQGGETSEEPSVPWICDIYRRDIVQFLTREEIEEMRVALPSWMLPVMACPKMLPRRVYDRLELINAAGNNYRVNEKGYIWFGDGRHRHGMEGNTRTRLAGDPFHEILEFAQCCKDEKAKTAETLAGQLLYPKLDEKTPVGLRLTVPLRQYIQRTVVWRAANKLTKDTAAGLLHFLHHLDGCCVRRLIIQTDLPDNNDGDAADGGKPRGVLNPRIFEVYGDGKALRLYAKKLSEWGDGDGFRQHHVRAAAGLNPLNPPRTTDLVTVKTARQLCGGGKSIHPFPCVSVCFNNGQAVLDLISSLRPYCSRLMVHTARGRAPADILVGIDQILNYFKHDFGGSLATLIPRVEFTMSGGGALYGVPLPNGLPPSCPKSEATTKTQEQGRAGYRRVGRGGGVLTQVTYKYRFETPAFGEHFNVKIRTVRLRQRAAQRMAGAEEEMYGVELRFDNADDTSSGDGQTDIDLDY